jgi:hypothetical protein
MTVETISLVGNQEDGYSLRLSGKNVIEAAKLLGSIAEHQVINFRWPDRAKALEKRADILRIVEHFPWNH